MTFSAVEQTASADEEREEGMLSDEDEEEEEEEELEIIATPSTEMPLKRPPPTTDLPIKMPPPPPRPQVSQQFIAMQAVTANGTTFLQPYPFQPAQVFSQQPTWTTPPPPPPPPPLLQRPHSLGHSQAMPLQAMPQQTVPLQAMPYQAAPYQAASVQAAPPQATFQSLPGVSTWVSDVGGQPSFVSMQHPGPGVPQGLTFHGIPPPSQSYISQQFGRAVTDFGTSSAVPPLMTLPPVTQMTPQAQHQYNFSHSHRQAGTKPHGALYPSASSGASPHDSSHGSFHGPSQLPSHAPFTQVQKGPFYCEQCDRNLWNKERLDMHLTEDHVECDYDEECDWSGPPAALHSHKITHIRDSSGVPVAKSATETEAWLAARRRRRCQRMGVTDATIPDVPVSELEKYLRTDVLGARQNSASQGRRNRQATIAAGGAVPHAAQYVQAFENKRCEALAGPAMGGNKNRERCNLWQEFDICEQFLRTRNCRFGNACVRSHDIRKYQEWQVNRLRSGVRVKKVNSASLIYKLYESDIRLYEDTLLQIFRALQQHKFFLQS